MGAISRPGKVKLITGLIARDTGLFSRIKKPLEKALRNTIDYESPLIDFVQTDYYVPEMGDGLKRIFFGYRDAVSLEDIYAVKIRTNALEKRYCVSANRTVNIDPGYLDLSKVVLFSTKDYTHRIHLSKGIFAEVTLFYQDNTFNPWPWTYPDYRTKCYIDIFNGLRRSYKEGSRS